MQRATMGRSSQSQAVQPDIVQTHRSILDSSGDPNVSKNTQLLWLNFGKDLHLTQWCSHKSMGLGLYANVKSHGFNQELERVES